MVLRVEILAYDGRLEMVLERDKMYQIKQSNCTRHWVPGGLYSHITGYKTL